MKIAIARELGLAQDTVKAEDDTIANYHAIAVLDDEGLFADRNTRRIGGPNRANRQSPR